MVPDPITLKDSMSAQPRLLVIEDDPFMAEAMQISLTGAGYVVRVEASGGSIDRALAEFRPSAALIDLHFTEGPDGVAIARRLRALSDLPVMFVSASDRVEDRLAGFEVGADDFLTKPFSMAELLARVKVLLRRSNQLTSLVIEVGDIRIDDRAHVATRAGNVLPLRNIEYKLLGTFCRHAGHVLSKTQLLDAVWGFTWSDVNLVEVHVSQLRANLEAYGPRVIKTIRSVGYVLEGDISSQR
ncbi:MAG: response regulator transcription factor [Actinomycetes bacterium]